jgi:uncharacterized membrane protein (DUF2068 family)
MYVIPNRMAALSSPPGELLAFVGIVGLLSVVGAAGYWAERAWGWFVHLVSVLGQLVFPGSLFELKPDWYHMVGWAAPVISLAILILMGLRMRRIKRGKAGVPEDKWTDS